MSERTDQPTTTAEHMRYPATDAHGRVFDLFVPHTGRDPYVDECPPWCDYVGDHHGPEMSDEDRGHFGMIYRVPVRSLPCEVERSSDPDNLGGQIMGAAMAYLKLDALHRDPQIWLSKGDVPDGLLLTLSEAEEIATLLSTLVRTAEAGR